VCGAKGVTPSTGLLVRMLTTRDHESRVVVTSSRLSFSFTLNPIYETLNLRPKPASSLKLITSSRYCRTRLLLVKGGCSHVGYRSFS